MNNSNFTPEDVIDLLEIFNDYFKKIEENSNYTLEWHINLKREQFANKKACDSLMSLFFPLKNLKSDGLLDDTRKDFNILAITQIINSHIVRFSQSQELKNNCNID